MMNVVSILEQRAVVVFGAIAAVAIAVVVSLSLAPSVAYAGGGVMLNSIYSGTHKESVLPGAGSTSNTVYYISDAYKAIANAKSSNTKVATLKVTKVKPRTYPGGYKVAGYYTMAVTLKKAGTTKISYTYRNKKHTVTFKVSNYANPIKSLKLGSKNYSGCFAAKKLFKNGRGYVSTLSTSKISGKLNVTAASGWKVNKIYYYGVKNTTIKNGSKVTKQFTLEMKNKKTGLVETFWIQPTYKRVSSIAQTASSGGGALRAAGIA